MDLVQLESLKTQLTQYLLDSISNDKFYLSSQIIDMLEVISDDLKAKKED